MQKDNADEQRSIEKRDTNTREQERNVVEKKQSRTSLIIDNQKLAILNVQNKLNKIN
jgi:hypothetical protein